MSNLILLVGTKYYFILIVAVPLLTLVEKNIMLVMDLLKVYSNRDAILLKKELHFVVTTNMIKLVHMCPENIFYLQGFVVFSNLMSGQIKRYGVQFFKILLRNWFLIQ